MQVGSQIPEATFLVLQDDKPTPLTTAELFNDKKVVLFAVPGAFTPGCSKTHCPSFVMGSEKLKQKGIDAVYCIAVNDCYVMDAWAKDQHAEGKITFLADGNGEFTRKMNLVKDTGSFGGQRSERYALIANNGVIEHIAVDSQGVKDTTAEALLEHL